MAKQTAFSRQLESVDHRREENIVKKPTTLSLVAAAAAVTLAAGAFAATADQYRFNAPTPKPLSRSDAFGYQPLGTGNYSENFDSYAAGSQIIGQGGWEGWLGDPNAGALVDDDFSVSPSNSINVSTVTDIVQQFSGYTTGAYTVTAQQYIPAGFAGESYFILQNTYVGTTNWSTQVTFSSTTGQATNTGVTGGSVAYVTDQWVELRVEIDLDANTQTFFYDGQQLFTGTWTEEVSGGGALNIASMNLYANGASPVYYDDITIEAVGGADYAVSLTADPDAQDGAAGDTVTYTVEVENTGVLDDTYDLTASGIWTATPSVATLAVAAGATETFTVDVEIDAGAVSGDSDVTEVTATSQGDDTVTASIDLTTSVAGVEDGIFCDGFEGGDGSCDGGGGTPGVYTTREDFLENVSAGFFENDFSDTTSGPSPPLNYSQGGFAYTVSASTGDLFNDPGLISTDQAADSIVVTFTGDPVTAIGGNFWATDIAVQPTGTDVTITLSDGTVETYTSTGPTDFRGFVTTVPITSITIDAPDVPNPFWPTMDNLIVGD
jgi:hypothetical protein